MEGVGFAQLCPHTGGTLVLLSNHKSSPHLPKVKGPQPYRNQEEMLDAEGIFHVWKAISKCLRVVFLDIATIQGHLAFTCFIGQKMPGWCINAHHLSHWQEPSYYNRERDRKESERGRDRKGKRERECQTVKSKSRRETYGELCLLCLVFVSNFLSIQGHYGKVELELLLQQHWRRLQLLHLRCLE